MDTDELLLVKLLWPPTPQDKAKAKHHRATLSAGRKCLLTSAPMELEGTGLYLMPERYEPELRACLDEILPDAYLEAENCLLVMRAPPIDEYSKELYERSVRFLQSEFNERCKELAARVLDIKITARFLDKADQAIQDILMYTQSEELLQIKQYLDKLSKHKLTDDRAKYSKYLLKIGAKCMQYHWEAE